MEAFIAAATEYAKHPSETTASVLQRNLGVRFNESVIQYEYIVGNDDRRTFTDPRRFPRSQHI